MNEGKGAGKMRQRDFAEKKAGREAQAR